VSHGLMMDYPLTLSTIFRRAETLYAGRELVTRLADKSLQRTTYGDFAVRARRLARALCGLGIQPGDRVATLGWNHYQHLEEQEGEPFGPGLVLRGAMERLSPILMTATATALALVPLVAAGAIPGHEIEHPMAIVILCGLVTSTMLNLLVVPFIYLHFGARRRRTEAVTAQ